MVLSANCKKLQYHSDSNKATGPLNLAKHVLTMVLLDKGEHVAHRLDRARSFQKARKKLLHVELQPAHAIQALAPWKAVHKEQIAELTSRMPAGT